MSILTTTCERIRDPHGTIDGICESRDACTTQNHGVGSFRARYPADGRPIPCVKDHGEVMVETASGGGGNRECSGDGDGRQDPPSRQEEHRYLGVSCHICTHQRSEQAVARGIDVDSLLIDE